jgi:hypothetical protein
MAWLNLLNLLNQSKVLCAVCWMIGIQISLRLTRSHFQMMMSGNLLLNLSNFGNHFALVERRLSGQTYLNASTIFPIIRNLDRHLREFKTKNQAVSEIVDVMEADLGMRWSDMGFIFTNAVILNPRTKLRVFDEPNFILACSELKKEFDELPVPCSVLTSATLAHSNEGDPAESDIFEFDDSLLRSAPVIQRNENLFDPATE